MEIEHLNKHQIVLLTFLVSFISSIVTGIITVSLMQQAPPAITQTVNRVVEHTVEKVVPGQTAASAAVSQPITKTVVVKESDAIAAGVSAATPSLVRLYLSNGEQQFIGLGVVLTPTGLIAADSASLGDNADATVDLSGVHVRAFVVSRDTATGVAYLRAATTTADGAPVPAWKPVSFTGQRPVLGQSVVALSGKSSIRLGQGIITASQSLGESKVGGGILETNVAEGSIMQGSMLIDTEGALIGMSTGIARAAGASDFLSADLIGMKEGGGGQQ